MNPELMIFNLFPVTIDKLTLLIFSLIYFTTGKINDLILP